MKDRTEINEGRRSLVYPQSRHRLAFLQTRPSFFDMVNGDVECWIVRIHGPKQSWRHAGERLHDCTIKANPCGDYRARCIHPGSDRTVDHFKEGK